MSINPSSKGKNSYILGPAMVGISYILLASALCWPLLQQIQSSILLGTEPCGTVPLFNLWTLKWNELSFASLLNQYWQAPIFFPETKAFANSDPQPLSGLLFFAINSLGGNDVLSYNIISILYLALNGAAAYYLFRSLGISIAPAGLSGALAISLPFVGNELGVLQLTAVFPVFYSLAFLYKFSVSKNFSNALFLGLWTGASYLFSNYYGIYLSLFLLLSVFFLFGYSLFNIKVLLKSLLAAIVSIAVIAPIAYTQYGISKDYSRGKKVLVKTSAEAKDYLRLDKRALGAEAIPWLTPKGGSGQKLYPGTALLLLALLAIFIKREENRPHWLNYFSSAALLALLLSFGLKLNVGGWQPYELIREHIPGFRMMRSSFRFSVFVQIFLLGLAAYGSSILWRWKSPLGKILAVTIVFAGVLESIRIPQSLYRVPSTSKDRNWITKINNLPSGALAHLPFPASGKACAYQETVIAMLAGLNHSQPMVNGYSGLFPATYRKLYKSMKKFPSKASIDLLRSTNTRYLVVDTEWYRKNKLESKLQTPSRNLLKLFSDENKTIFEIQ